MNLIQNQHRQYFCSISTFVHATFLKSETWVRLLHSAQNRLSWTHYKTQNKNKKKKRKQKQKTIDAYVIVGLFIFKWNELVSVPQSLKSMGVVDRIWNTSGSVCRKSSATLKPSQNWLSPPCVTCLMQCISIIWKQVWNKTKTIS